MLVYFSATASDSDNLVNFHWIVSDGVITHKRNRCSNSDSVGLILTTKAHIATYISYHSTLLIYDYDSNYAPELLVKTSFRKPRKSQVQSY